MTSKRIAPALNLLQLDRVKLHRWQRINKTIFLDKWACGGAFFYPVG
ncbi:hypothetical protein [Bartonella sp. ML70XJBT.G]|nr:hypothetical protein [Bartonella sp. ML70XJBT.G]